MEIIAGVKPFVRFIVLLIAFLAISEETVDSNRRTDISDLVDCRAQFGSNFSSYRDDCAELPKSPEELARAKTFIRQNRGDINEEAKTYNPPGGADLRAPSTEVSNDLQRMPLIRDSFSDRVRALYKLFSLGAPSRSPYRSSIKPKAVKNMSKWADDQISVGEVYILYQFGRYGGASGK